MNYLKALIEKGGPRVHAALALLAGGTLALCTLALTSAAIFGSKNLLAELGIFVSALTGLGGYVYKTAKNER